MQLISYKNLIVWEKAMQLVIEVYAVIEKFPKTEIYGLSSQIKRAAVSIPSNIAEGKMRGTVKDYRRFLFMAYSSGAELETQIEIAKRLRFANNEVFKKMDDLLSEIMKMLNVIIHKLKLSVPNI